MKRDDVKSFTTRTMSPELHRRWKTAAAARGITMEEFLYAAIELQIENDLKKLMAKKKEDIESSILKKALEEDK